LPHNLNNFSLVLAKVITHAKKAIILSLNILYKLRFVS
jgi:hypothetical protein